MLKIALRGRKSTARGERVARRVKAISSYYFFLPRHLWRDGARKAGGGEVKNLFHGG